ncbi:MAG: sialidase family protein [Actinomycetota bacterium]
MELSAVAARSTCIAVTLTVALAAGAVTIGFRSTTTSDHDHRGAHHSHTMPAALDFEDAVIGRGEGDEAGQKGSGGRAVVHRAGGKTVRSPRLTRMAPDARLHRTGYVSWEPTMGVTKRGTVVLNGMGETGEPLVIRSDDKGRTWKTAFDGHGFTADPYLYVDPDTSRIFANDFLIPTCHLISTSDDEGKSWTTSPPAACGHNEDHQTVFAGPPPKGEAEPEGYPNVVYICSIGGGASIASTASVCSRSLDGGTTFLPSGAPAFTDDPTKSGDYGVPGLCNGANGHGFVGSDGTVYLPRGWCGQPWLAISRDEGATWTRVQVAENGMPCCAKVEGTDGELFSHEAGVVADADDNVYYTWVAADRLPYLAISRDGGKTWGKPMMIGPPGIRETLLPGIDIGAKGRVVVQYMGSANSAWDGHEVEGSYEDTTWNAYVTMTTRALADDPVFYSATINHPSEPLWRTECGPDPIRCAWGDFLDVVVGPDGTPWSVAVDLCDAKGCGGTGEAIIGRLVGGPSLRGRG